MAGFPSDSTTNGPSLMVKWTTIRARTGRIKNDTITYNASSREVYLHVAFQYSRKTYRYSKNGNSY